MFRSIGRLLALSAFCCVVSSSAIGQVQSLPVPRISWHVENSFRFFTDAADTEVHRATYLALPPEARLQHPVLAAEQALSRRHDEGWAATMFRNTCWDARTNRFDCPDVDDYINPKTHRVVAMIENVDEAARLDCTWLTAPHGGDNPRGKVVTQPCNKAARFDIPYPDGAAVKVEIGGREIASQDIRVRDLLVVGMGDSIASGEGNPDVPVRFSRERSASYGKRSAKSDLTGYPARVGPWKQIGDKAFIEENPRWSSQACHRSLYSHQLRAALQLGIEDPHRAVTYVGVACSGSEVTYGLFLRYTGNEWVPNPPDMSQISAVASAQCDTHEAPLQDLPEAYHMGGTMPELKGGLVLRKCDPLNARKIDLLLLSIGGNDVGFARLLANAVLADQSLLRKLGGWIGQVHGLDDARSQLEALILRYKSLNRAIHYILHIPWKEADRVLLTAYPGIALLGDGSKVCPDGRAGMEVLSDFKMSEAKAKVGTWIADRLNHAMQDAAKEYHWTFVDSHRREFIGRGICAGTTYDGADIADDLRLPRKTANGWRPYNPGDYRAYASRQRWFRTPNDAFMTANFHVAASLLQKVLKLDALSWFQLVLASTYSGAFHPTAEGQAAIADAVVHSARAVLKKYGQGPDPAVARGAHSERPPRQAVRSLQ
jgi:lysophospholipase L1-like esterase